MPARIPSSRSLAATPAGPDHDQPAPNRAARRARRKGGTEPQRATPDVQHAHRGAVSTKPVHPRADFAARRSG
ncbi:hypothetical protein GCM10023403_43680 [Pseudonocardia benzenivorans]|nr:hypothetical protein PSD17_07720 [Pseudonocardia sp. D17]